MSDTAIFMIVFVGLFVLRIIVATIVFYFILDRGDHCPWCNEVTLRVQPSGWGRIVPFLRSSWCLACGWTGYLRYGPVTQTPQPSTLVADANTPAR
jgi:hypothetical protein